ncbi:MAG TPA: DUF3300 domain-containing protein [Opitutaceae bacterium]|nr:DUF3300 domain-containing protein [Opitutaceae bacterium]
MKTKFLLLAFALFGSAPLFAQPLAPAATPSRSPEQLDQLLSPIALYPDPLVAVILPAATAPSDVVLASRLVASTNDPAAIDAQTWDESVKAVAHYPELVTWMDQNLDWTEQLGGAFLEQPADVMNSIQRLRFRAREAGILVDTPQQQVLVQSDIIYVLPAQPDVVYVPSYDPQIFTRAEALPRSPGLISFSLGFAAGPWLDYGFDWGARSVWIDRRRDWSSHRDWRSFTQPSHIRAAEVQTWQPRTDAANRQTIAHASHRAEIAQPVPFSRAGSNSRAAATYAPSHENRVRAEQPLSPTGREPRFERAQPPQPAPTPSYSERTWNTEPSRSRAAVSAPTLNAPATAPAPVEVQRAPVERSARPPSAEESRRWEPQARVTAPAASASPRIESSAPPTTAEHARELPPQAAPAAQEHAAKESTPPPQAHAAPRGKEEPPKNDNGKAKGRDRKDDDKKDDKDDR